MTYHEEWYLKNKKRISLMRKKYYILNKKKIKKYTAKYRKLNKKKIAQYQKNYAKKNKLKFKNYKKNYYQKNKKKIHKQNVLYLKHNIQARLASNIRKRFLKALKNNYKKGSAVENLGCSINKFKIYIENKFLFGMNWANYGHGDNKWHLDHIRPLASFNLTNIKQLKKACHYTNLQPMWAKDNLSKGSKWQK